MNKIIEFIEYVEQIKEETLPLFLDQVLHKIRDETNAEAGTIFILRKSRKSFLEPVSIQNDKIAVLTTKFNIDLQSPAIASYVASSGLPVLIDDVYLLDENLPYKFNKTYDIESGYKSKSVMAFPLSTFEGKTIGVVQLINRRLKGVKHPIPFESAQVKFVSAVNHIIGRAIERIDAHEKIATKKKELEKKNRLLEKQKKIILHQQAETENAFKISIELLAKAAELHDEVTGNHIVRVNEYSYVLAQELGMPQDFCDEIRYSAQLHDVGKMSVNSAILKKHSGLNPDERAEMDLHTYYGHQILSHSDRLKMASDIAYCHHEKWDGSGYPRGLKGSEIPIAARIVQIADIYDALRSERPYKKGYAHEKACQIILEGDERIDTQGHFDPKLLEVFKQCHSKLNQIWIDLTDK